MRLSSTAILCFIAVYIIWGSTYFAIRLAIDTIPPWTLSAVRYIIAGALMAVLAKWRNEGPLSRYQVKIGAISGVFLVMANGVVCVAEQWVPSSIAAVIIGAMPIWIMILGWIAFQQNRPSLRKIAGATLGLVGIAVIASQNNSTSAAVSSTAGALMLVSSSWLWAAGTLLQRKTLDLKSTFKFSAVQMSVGALAAFIPSVIFEKPWTIDPQTVSMQSILSLVYLVVFGSIIAFTAYSWLSRNVEPHLSSTYALVNPLIAVALGAVFLNERLTFHFIIATFFVGAGLALLIFSKRKIRPHSASNASHSA